MFPKSLACNRKAFVLLMSLTVSLEHGWRSMLDRDVREDMN